jgi:hypothetical protein
MHSNVCTFAKKCQAPNAERLQHDKKNAMGHIGIRHLMNAYFYILPLGELARLWLIVNDHNGDKHEDS